VNEKLTSTTKDELGHNQIWSGAAADIRQKRRAGFLLTHAPSASSILEIGCGLGDKAIEFLTLSTRPERYVGLDVSEKFVEQANIRYRNDPRISFVCESFANFVDNEGFDLVCGDGILHHLCYNLNDSFAEIRNLLKPGGQLAFIEPNISNPAANFVFCSKTGRRLAKLEDTEMAFPARAAESMLRSSGFTGVKVTNADFLLPFVPTWAVNTWISAERRVMTTRLRWLSQSILITAVRP
jgi:SAM-dependent methyltransferase